jgi:hypothetical protein
MMVGAAGGDAPEIGVKLRAAEAALNPTLVCVFRATE